MKLLIFSPYYPPHTGGLESHSDEFNRHLAEEGVHITVFTPRLPITVPPLETRFERVQVIRFPAIELIPNYPLPKFWQREFWHLWRELHQEHYNLVLSRTRFFFTSLMAWRYARKNVLPWVHIEHGSDFATFNGRLKTALGKLYDYTLGSFVLRESDANIANSQASRDFVGKLSHRKDCSVIYRGVEKEIIESVAPHQFFATHFSGKTVVGFIGRLIDGKGVFDLVEAFSNLTTDTSICAIIGDGPERARLEKFIAQKKISDKVVLLGEKPFTEAMALMKSFDIFINPSYTEGIPTAVIEAALCRKAIIATNVGGTNEIISGNGDGFLIASYDTNDLQKKLALLIQDPSLRQTFGEQAFASVQSKFDWDHATKQYLNLFNSILKK